MVWKSQKSILIENNFNIWNNNGLFQFIWYLIILYLIIYIYIVKFGQDVPILYYLHF